MDDAEIPPYFLCPISLQIMKDPVTVASGISYDRGSIERWLSAYDRNTCPVTNQLLIDRSVTPNNTLLRLIQSWIAGARRSKNTASNDLPKPSFDASKVCQELDETAGEPQLQMRCLKKIKMLVQEDDERKVVMEKAGVTSLVATLITKPSSPEMQHLGDDLDVVGEAVTVMQLLSPSAETLKQISTVELLRSLALVLQSGTYQARIHAALLLRAVLKADNDAFKADLPAVMFDSIVEILKDQNSSNRITMALLSILMEVMLHGNNINKVIQAGAITVLVELLMEEREDRRMNEAMLYVLELSCRRAAGRTALLAHSGGVAVVAGKILRVSHAATERAVKVLLQLCRYCEGPRVVEEMMEVGGVAKLCMVVQVERNQKTKDRAKEILGLHLKSWSKFPCFPLNCLP